MDAGRPTGPGGDDPFPAGGDLFAAGGEAGRLMAALDWSATPVGPVEAWPASLRFAVRTILVSRFPMVLTWGPEFIQFYNDAYAPFIGAKHPAIGQDIRITLAEGWDALGPPIAHAMETLEASWLPGLLLLLERAGYREETYFTVSHAPAFGDDGEVAGMHAVCTEVTGEVLGARRQALLHDLATVGGQLGEETRTVQSMCSALSRNALDIPFAAVYLAAGETAAGEGEVFRRTATIGCDPDLLPAELPAGTSELPLPVEGLGVVGGPFGDRVTDAAVLPLTASRDAEPIGLLVAGRSPNRALDAEYATFHELVAGQFAGAVMTIRAFEAERHRARALAELDRAKTTFFADVSHELRTPLTLLLGPIGDVLDDPDLPLPSDSRDQLSLAFRNGRRLQRLVNDLLDFASIEAGRAHPVRVQTDVATYTADLAGIFRAAAERAGLDLTVTCPALPRTSYVDPRMWEKIVVNLLSNAVKYTFVGEIEVAVHGEEDRFLLRVRDTGVGIPAEELPQLFQRFHRVAGAAARTREGTGIGLALVSELAALHGGSVSVQSRPDTGSTFTVALPYGAPDAEADTEHGPVEPSESARGEAAGWEQDTVRPAATQHAHRPGTGLLVVDDNADMRSYLTRLLAPHWSVRTTANGEEALSAVADEAPALVLTDVMMPRVDGFELLRALRADPATCDIPVIMLTARAGQEASVEGLEAGADDYLAKPFRAEELLARIRAVLERTAGRTPPEHRAAAPARATAPREEGPRPDAGLPPMPPLRPAVPPASVPPPRTEGAAPSSPSGGRHAADWRLPAAVASVPVLRHHLRSFLAESGVGEDQAYDLLLAACEAVTNAVEHAQDPVEPYVDVAARAVEDSVRISVRDYGQWRERGASMDRGRGSTLMSAFADVTATRSPEGTTVVIRSSVDRGLPG